MTVDRQPNCLEPHRPAGRYHMVDPVRERALLRAMRGALRRSTVLLPLTEEDDLLQRSLEDALGVLAWE